MDAKYAGENCSDPLCPCNISSTLYMKLMNEKKKFTQKRYNS